MPNFVQITDLNTNKTVLLNARYIETVTEESWGISIHLALQAPDCDEKNVYAANLTLNDFLDKLS